MKNNNWFKIIIAIAILIVACSAGYYFVSLPNQQKPIGNINFQSECATQSQKVLNAFEKKYTNDGWLTTDAGTPTSTRANFNQQNHYNQILNKCFVIITYDYTYAGTLNSHFTDDGETLFDAYQNDELASCVHADREAYGNFSSQHTDTCLIGLNNGVVSYDKYKDFVNQRMEK